MHDAILVTGGAGYIGSHTVLELVRAGREVVVVDNLSKGHVRALRTPHFIEGDIADPSVLERIFSTFPIKKVIHFAAQSLVAESMRDPRKYFRENVVKGLALFDALIDAGVEGIVLSSTAAVYGHPQGCPIPEDAPAVPVNPYGESKLFLETALCRYAQVYGMKAVSLRYFNAAGADPGGELGEDHDPETHLIPNILNTALGKKDRLEIFGDDYPTDDGTAVRDYIHVTDLARAHILALDRIAEGPPWEVFNLGNARGFSVRQVLDCAERIIGREIPFEIAPRRAGDPATLVADASKAAKILGWQQNLADLETIVGTAWQWARAHPKGYGR